MAIRKLASASIDLGTNAPQTVDMSAYTRYVVTGIVLADQSGTGAASLAVNGPGGAFILQPRGQVGSAAGWNPVSAPVSPIFSGNITVTHGGTLLPGQTVTVEIFGDDDI